MKGLLFLQLHHLADFLVLAACGGNLAGELTVAEVDEESHKVGETETRDENGEEVGVAVRGCEQVGGATEHS